MTATRGNSLKLHQRKSRLDTREIFYTKRVDKHWNTLSREVVESPSQEILKRHLGMVLRDIVQWWTWQCWGNVGLNGLRGLF